MTNEARKPKQASDADGMESIQDTGREATREEAMMAGRAIPEAAPGTEGFPEGVPETKPEQSDDNEADTEPSEFPH